MTTLLIRKYKNYILRLDESYSLIKNDTTLIFYQSTNVR